MYAIKKVVKGKGKHSRKYKSIVIEADKPEPDLEPEVAYIIKEIINGRGKRS